MAEAAEIITRRSPLQHRAEALAAASDASASIVEIPFQALTVVRGDLSDTAFRERSAGALGYDLPSAPNGTASDHRTTALWLGPDEWLVIGPDGSGADTRARLRGMLRAARIDPDGVVIVGETALESSWSATASLAGHVPAERFFAAR